MTVTFKLTAPFYEGLVYKNVEFLNNKTLFEENS